MLPTPLRLALLASLLVAGACPAADLPEPFVGDGARAGCDLGGMWEAHAVPVDLAWPPPADGWKPQRVPHEHSRFVTLDEAGGYFSAVDKVVEADGSPVEKERPAAWFRRAFTLGGAVPAGMRALLRLDGLAWRHRVVLNDHPVGGSVLGLVPHVYDVTALLRPGDNRLAVGVTGRAGLWNQAERTFVAPLAGVLAGIHGRVHLELVPEARCDDVFVRTSVARRRIEIDCELANDGAGERFLAAEAAVRDPAGVLRLALRGEAVAVPAGGRRTVTLGADWLADDLWWPGSPNLHSAEVRVLEGGAERDRTRTAFGFREFTAKGVDFQLNGRRQVLLRNSWLCFYGGGRERVMEGLRGDLASFNCLRLHLNQIDPCIPEQADRVGMLVIPEFWGWYQDSDSQFPIAKAAAWRDNVAETMRRTIRRYRNHPSIIMWSLTNETFWNTTAAPRMAVADLLVATARAADPTRLLQGDAEITWDGRLDAISIHYPEGDAGTLGKAYENSGWLAPNDLGWLRRDRPSHGWRSDFTWDRPLMFGEFLLHEGDPEPSTAYCGEAAYDRAAWELTAFDGRGAPTTFGSPWIDMVRMSCDHYRAAGVACLNPWTGRGDQLLPSMLVAPLDHHPNAFGGEPSRRRLVVANDSNQGWNGLHVQAALTVDGRTVWSALAPAPAGPGETRQLELEVLPPAVERSTAATLVLRLCHDLHGTRRELHRRELPLWIMPRASLAGADARAVALVDGADGATAKALAALGLAVDPGPGDDAALGGKRLLVIGEEAAGRADLAAAARFAERGGQMLVLHQRATSPFLPGQPEIDPRHAATYSWRAAPHPALDGFDDRQLRHWRPDHVVATESLIRPSAGAALGAAVSGGRYGMHWSPLATVRHGRGAAVFCQYRLADRVAVEPAAGHLLAQAVRGALAAAPADPAPALRLEGANARTRAVLEACHVRLAAAGAAGAGPVLLDARHPPAADALARLRAEVEAGGTLWLRGLDQASLPAVQGLLPWTPGFAPAGAWSGAVLRRPHALAAGLGSGDLHWARGNGLGKPTAPLGGPALTVPSLDAAVVITDPALLVAVPLGRGWILLDQLAWDAALGVETERVTRIVSCLARGAGAGFDQPASRRFRFIPLDLARHANRGFVDEKAGDGVGGVADQGINDLRYFLTNHTGMVGGMAVAAEPFPTLARLAEVDFRLIDPKANGGRSLVAFRGRGHDPAALERLDGIDAGGATAEQVWFLHAGCWQSDQGFGAPVARYVITYADGTRAEQVVRYGQEITDWWDPSPLPGAQVAWTGRNEMHSPIGIYACPWDNPHPGKPIAAIGVEAGLAETQLVLLAITLASEEGGERAAAAWDLGRFAAGAVAAAAGGQPLTGSGTAATCDGRTALRLEHGQSVSARLPAGNPLAAGTPFAIELEVAPEAKPDGYCGGLFEAGAYQRSGLRLVLGHDLKVSVEHWAGDGAERTTYFTTREPLPLGRFSTVRYEHDGTQGRLLVDGQVQEVKACPPPAAYDGGVRLGVAGGQDYHFNGCLGRVRLLARASPTP